MPDPEGSCDPFRVTHIVIEHSSNLRRQLNLPKFVEAIRQAALATGIFPLGNMRTRAYESEPDFDAHCPPDNTFVHLSVRVGHGPDHSTDVYIQIAVLHGVITLWDVTRFSSAQETGPGVEVVEGHMVQGKGNVEDMHVMWTMRALSDECTVLKLDMLLKPGLPAPQSAIDEELRDSARYAVDSIHDRAQGNKDFAAWPGSG